jgi:hypothetical protein
MALQASDLASTLTSWADALSDTLAGQGTLRVTSSGAAVVRAFRGQAT